MNVNKSWRARQHYQFRCENVNGVEVKKAGTISVFLIRQFSATAACQRNTRFPFHTRKTPPLTFFG